MHSAYYDSLVFHNGTIHVVRSKYVQLAYYNLAIWGENEKYILGGS